MPGSHWMLVLSPENWEITRGRGVDVIGLRHRHRKKAERMVLGDRILFYVQRRGVFAATASVVSTYFEDHSRLWQAPNATDEHFPYRVRVEPKLLLEPDEYIDAYQIAPRMLYVKRWPPEAWPLAFQGDIHLLASADFALIEAEMERQVEQRSTNRRGGATGPPSEAPAGSPGARSGG